MNTMADLLPLGLSIVQTRYTNQMKRALVTVAVLLAVTPGFAFAQNVKLEIKDGLVNLSTQSAPVSQILAAWAKVGRTTIVNGDKVPGAPLSVELTGVTEKAALQTLLRSASGYMAVVRAVPESSASIYDRIWVLPTSSTPTTAFSAPSPVSMPQQYPVYPNVPVAGGPGLEGAMPVMINDPNGTLMRPVPMQIPPYPGAQVISPTLPQTFSVGGTTFTGQPGQPAANPQPGTTMPVGAAVPGMIIAPPPPQPGQGPPTIVYPGNVPNQPNQPVRK